MSRWKLTLEYDGGAFCGWQRQGHDPLSVQQVVEEAIQKFCGQEVTLHAAGRTDSGVHAKGQVAHVDLIKPNSGDVIRDALNFHLRPHKIVIVDAEPVADDFHARFNAVNRRYCYQILNRRAPSALLEGYAWYIGRPLSIEAMQRAANLMIGQHDFSTFRAQHCQSKSPIKTLDFLTIEKQDELILFHVQARSFLYHQVRNMVGTLSLVGYGKWSIEDFANAFAARDRNAGGPTAPSHGLYFIQASY